MLVSRETAHVLVFVLLFIVAPIFGVAMVAGEFITSKTMEGKAKGKQIVKGLVLMIVGLATLFLSLYMANSLGVGHLLFALGIILTGVGVAIAEYFVKQAIRSWRRVDDAKHKN